MSTEADEDTKNPQNSPRQKGVNFPILNLLYIETYINEIYKKGTLSLCK